MKLTTATTKRKVLMMALLVCVVMGAATAAFCVSPNEVLRNETSLTFTGLCCFTWGETVSVNEPAKVAPVVITWSGKYNALPGVFVGLMVNGGPCLFYGAGSLQAIERTGLFESRLLQWVVLPSDGLHTGANTFTLCGGGMQVADAHITLFSNTLAARIAK